MSVTYLDKSLELNISLLFTYKIVANICTKTKMNLETLKGKITKWDKTAGSRGYPETVQKIQKTLDTTGCVLNVEKYGKAQHSYTRDEWNVVTNSVGNSKLTVRRIRRSWRDNCGFSCHVKQGLTKNQLERAYMSKVKTLLAKKRSL